MILCIMMFSGLNCLASSTETIHYKAHSTGYIGENVLFYENPYRGGTMHDTWAKYKNGKFKDCEKPVFARAPSESEFWFVFSVMSESEEDVWLNVNSSTYDSLCLYKVNRYGRVIDSIQTGNYKSWSDRIVSSPTFWFPLISAKDTTTYHYFVRVITSTSIEIPMVLGDMASIIEVRRTEEYMSMIFTGALFLMFIYNCFLFFYSKENVYMYYLLYIFCIILVTTFLNNFPIVEYILGHQFTYDYILAWVTPGYVFIGLLFTEYLKLKDKYPVFYRIFLINILILVCMGLSHFFISYPILKNMYMLFAGWILVLSLLTGYICLDKKSLGSVLFIIGWTIMAVSCLVYLLTIHDIVNYNLLTRNAMYFGIIIEIIFFSLSLAKYSDNLILEHADLNRKLKAKNEELIMVNESLDSFNYHINHDLKSTFGNISSLVMMVSKYTGKKDFHKVIEISNRILKVSIQGKETVMRFLSLGEGEYSITSGKQAKIIPELEISKIVEANGLETKVDMEVIADKVLFLTLNEKLFHTIFLNLITNSVKYSENFPVIKIKISETPEKYILIHEDNGIGIDIEKYGDKLFQPFTRINQLRVPGTGLGLYLLKRIVSRHKGTIKVQSELNKRHNVYDCFAEELMRLAPFVIWALSYGISPKQIHIRAGLNLVLYNVKYLHP